VNRNLARRLREARREAGYSTRAVAERLPKRIAVSHVTIAGYENGTSMPPVDVLAALADLYKRTINWFLENRESLGAFRYRNLPSRVPVTEQRRFEALAGKWADAYRHLEKFLKANEPRRRKSVFAAHEAMPPEQLAAMVRRGFLNLDDGQPIQNVVAVLESFSAWALEIEATFGVEGAAAQIGGDFVVLLNPRVTNERVRMNAAHELAHLLYSDCKRDLGWTDAIVEKKAYDFAVSLLLPESQLKTAFDGKSFLKLIQFKEKFGISLVAMIYMAERTGVINSTTARWLWSEITKRGWRADEPGYVWRDRAIAFETMLECAIQTKAITWTDAERVTGIREQELRERLANAMRIDKRPECVEPDRSTLKLSLFAEEQRKVT
jgi:Zn-dependent peptidase ImmA (M78 family)/transcriptional regulator with XRE-family HTH domain